MQTAANNRVLFTGSISLGQITELPLGTSQTEFYQQIGLELIKHRYSEETLLTLARRLVSLAGHLYAFRQMDGVERVSNCLLNMPLPREYQAVSCYYDALCQKRQGNVREAQVRLESLEARGPLLYRARAAMSLGVIALEAGDFIGALSLSIEACKRAASNGWCDPITTVVAQRNISVIRSMDGDHDGALDGLGRMVPVVRALASSNPSLLFDHLNSMAVELMEVGRLQEAAHASRIALASPYAPAYPEWHETGRDIALKARRASRSVVAIGAPLTDSQETDPSNRPPVKVLNTQALQAVPKPASILVFPRRPPRPEFEEARPSINAQELQRMPVGEKVALLMAHAQRAGASEELYDKLLHAAGLVIDRKRPNEIDLEGSGALEEMITLWINGGIDPEQFAAVMSALRDCDDELRRKNILDRMISFAFRETSQSLDSEDLWRRRVEARLEPIH